MRRWFSAAVAAIVTAGVVAVLTHSQLATVAACLTVYAVEMLRPDTPREAVMRRIREKEAEEHLRYNPETKKWAWLSDRELEELYEIESRLEAGVKENERKPATSMNVEDLLSQLEKQRQEIIDREARKGKTIEIAALRQRLEATKATYTGSDRDAYANEVDRLLDSLASRYGSCIPVDEAYRVMQKLERGVYSEEK